MVSNCSKNGLKLFQKWSQIDPKIILILKKKSHSGQKLVRTPCISLNKVIFKVKLILYILSLNFRSSLFRKKKWKRKCSTNFCVKWTCAKEGCDARNAQRNSVFLPSASSGFMRLWSGGEASAAISRCSRSCSSSREVKITD